MVAIVETYAKGVLDPIDSRLAVELLQFKLKPLHVVAAGYRAGCHSKSHNCTILCHNHVTRGGTLSWYMSLKRLVTFAALLFRPEQKAGFLFLCTN